MGIIRGERIGGRERVTLNGWTLPWALEGSCDNSPTGLEWGLPRERAGSALAGDPLGGCRSPARGRTSGAWIATTTAGARER